MSLSIALNSAFSGLAATSRNASLVSENIANALTPGYARRSLNLASQGDLSPGVRVTGVTRHADPAITANRREADAELGFAQYLGDFHARLAAVIGGPTDDGSLATKLAAFSESLINAASKPESGLRLDASVQSASDLASFLNDASRTIQNMRSDADRKIAIQVDALNNALQQVEILNTDIVSTISAGGPTASLHDQRQLLIDQINEIAPVNIAKRANGAVALYADGGAILLDGSAAHLSFTPSNMVVADMSLAGGSLSSLEINGYPVRTDSKNSVVIGGTLSAQFEIRDELGIASQADLDSVARDLIERFEDPALDATLTPGDPGLFTDNGAAFDPTMEVGLAARIAVNAIADPTQGGESWRLRDGLGAITPGAVGDARFLQALHGQLELGRTLGSGSFGSGLMSATDVGSALISRFAQNASTSDQRLSFASARQTELAQIELSRGVNSDEEIGNLLLIEQAYAANARMIEVIDDLMGTLLRI